jgi:hypothetical protein
LARHLMANTVPGDTPRLGRRVHTPRIPPHAFWKERWPSVPFTLVDDVIALADRLAPYAFTNRSGACPPSLNSGSTVSMPKFSDATAQPL